MNVHMIALSYPLPNTRETHFKKGCQYIEWVIGVNDHTQLTFATCSVFCKQRVNYP